MIFYITNIHHDILFRDSANDEDVLANPYIRICGNTVLHRRNYSHDPCPMSTSCEDQDDGSYPRSIPFFLDDIPSSGGYGHLH